jgi:glycosyltransferase involved in cell wall biosynthesis
VICRENALISVVIPLFNKSYSVINCIDSVVSQKKLPCEVIVVDDGSTDDSLSVVRSKYSNSQLVSIFSKPNGGVSSARNFGVSKAKGDFVAFLDADDQWDPEFLLEVESALEKFPCAAIVGAGHYINIIGKGGRCNRHSKILSKFKSTAPVENYFDVAKNASVLNSSKVCVSKKLLESVGGFPEGACVGEDVYVWTMLCLKSDPVYIPKSLATINVQEDDSRNARGGKMSLAIQKIDKIMLCAEAVGKSKEVLSYLELLHLKHSVMLLVGGYKKSVIAQAEFIKCYSFRYYVITRLLAMVPFNIIKYLKGIGRL